MLWRKKEVPPDISDLDLQVITGPMVENNDRT